MGGLRVQMSPWPRHLLPDEDVVNDGGAAKYDSEPDHDRGDDGRGRVEVEKCVQDDA